jgi:glycosyltransferase involved in cell wall biosynthesis
VSARHDSYTLLEQRHTDQAVADVEDGRLKVAVVMSREPSYTRNRVILDGLASAGAEIVEYTDSSPRYPARFARVLARFIARPPRDADLVLVGFFAQPMMPFISRLTKKPIVTDAFLSGYDTMCFDRKRFSPGSPAGRFFKWLDTSACERSDLVILDTREHISYFIDTFGQDPGKFARIFVGAETGLFKPLASDVDDDVFRVFYYCTFHPVHGTEYVLEAAGILKEHDDIRFTVVGGGQERSRLEGMRGRLALDNVEFVDWIEYRDLPRAIARADVCLGGHFGSVAKSSRVIPGKLYQFLAMGKPVIAGDNPANRELLEDRRDALLVEMASGEAIADAVLELKRDGELRETIARSGLERFEQTATPEIIGAELLRLMEPLVRST